MLARYSPGRHSLTKANDQHGFLPLADLDLRVGDVLKLGISLNRLGQTEQACAAYLAVSAEYPKAVEARKRAQAEAKRANCQA